MIARIAHSAAGMAVLAAAAVAIACAAPASPAVSSIRRRSPPPPASTTLVRPARYVATELAGVSFDAASRGSALPHAEPALLDGSRIVVDAGVIVAHRPEPDDLAGFSALPERTGGGYVLWSGRRTYRSRDFLGELVPVADVPAVGGARPFFTTVLLRTELGIFELDPASATVRRMDIPGIADALARDERRALRVDQLGRAEWTTDGGTTWTDIAKAKGMLATGIAAGETGELWVLGPNAPELVLDAAGHLAPWIPRPEAGDRGEGDFRGGALRARWPRDFAPVSAPSSLVLPAEAVAHAAVAGALLPGGRMLVVRENGLQLLSASTAQPLAGADFLGLSEDYARCQAVAVNRPGRQGLPDVLLACTHDRGAHVLAVQGRLATPKLEATFPQSAGFVAGLSGRFGFAGRCGSSPPGIIDFPGREGAGGAAPEPAEPDPPASGTETPPEDSAHFCIRAGPGDWVQRSLHAEHARRLYRFVPSDDAAVTALVLHAPQAGPREAPLAAAPLEGIRIVRVNPKDPALNGGRFPVVAPLRNDLPYRLIDTDYWLDGQDGSIRGWIILPDKEEPGEDSDEPDPLSARLGGRAAGVRISAAGEIEVFPLPAGTVEVVRGGPFALALAETGGTDGYYESTDGGRTWQTVQGPPAGRLRSPADAGDVVGCSAAGCTWGDGIVRLGWGASDKPAAAPTAASPAARSPSGAHIDRPSPIALSCRLKGSGEILRGGGPRDSSDPMTLLRPSQPGGAARNGTWTAEIRLPFGRSSPPRRISLRDEALGSLSWTGVPLLVDSSTTPVDLVLFGRAGRGQSSPGIRIGPGAARHRWDYPGRVTVMAGLSGGTLAALDADHSVIVLVRGDAAQPLLRLTRVPDVSRTRLTLALRLDAPGLAVAGISATSGDIFAGPLDLARAEVGPLVALGRLDSLTAGDASVCRSAVRKGPVYRLLADANLALALRGPEPLTVPSLQGIALLSATPERLCLEGLLMPLPGHEGTSLSVQVGAGGAAVVQKGKRTEPAECDVRQNAGEAP